MEDYGTGPVGRFRVRIWVYGVKTIGATPPGSIYTGIDRGAKLLEEAMELFSHLPFQSEFIRADLIDYEPVQKYDIALCHAFLLHMENPSLILSKMVRSVKSGGKVICFEPHWISCMANQYRSGYEQTEVVKLGILQKLYEIDAAAAGKDGNIGIKIPQLLSELSLANVECRVSDKVNFYDPVSGNEKLFESLKEEGFGAVPKEKDGFIESLVQRGLTHDEAELQYRTEYLSSVSFLEKGAQEFILHAPNMKISFGTVVGGSC